MSTTSIRSLAAFALATCTLGVFAQAQTACLERPSPPGNASFVSAVARVAPAVVKITTANMRNASGAASDVDPLGDETASNRTARYAATQWHTSYERGSASGFVVDPEGYILTSAHVVADAELIWVDVSSERRLEARVVGSDLLTDVAVLKVAAHGLPAVAIESHAALCPGDWVLALGAPFGFDRTVTAGIVSANPRFPPGGSGSPMIQSDVALNPGSSGGPLVDTRGNVVGMNSMIYSATGGYIGVSFSSPIDVVMRVAAQLRSRGKVARGEIGVKIQPVTMELARAFGLDGDFGALVIRVDADGPASRAGLLSGDILTTVDAIGPASYADVRAAVSAAREGQTLTLGVWRQQSLQKLEVTVREAAHDAAPQQSVPASHADRLGLALMERERRPDMKAAPGLYVVSVSGAALQAGLLPGDMVLAVNDASVLRIAEFDAALKRLRPGGPVALLVARRGVANFIPVPRSDND